MRNSPIETLLNSIGIGITEQDLDFNIIYQNSTMKEQFGNCIGKKCYKAYEQRESICKKCPVVKCLRDGKIHDVERHIVVNGAPIIFENRAAPVCNSNNEIVSVVKVVRDVTGRKKSEDRIARFRDLYAALSHTNKAIIQCKDSKSLFEHICRIAVEFGNFSLAIIGLLENDGNITPVAHFGGASRYLDSLVIHSDADKLEGQGPTGKAIRDGKPYICNDFHNDPATIPWRKSALKNKIMSSAAFPIKHNNQIFGVFKIYAERVGFFDREIVDLLLEMCANISFALDNLSREEQRLATEVALRYSEEQLKLVLEGSSDGYCDWHIERGIVNMSSRYCEILGYQQNELEQTPKTIKRLVNPEDWPKVEAYLNNELMSQSPTFEIEVRMLHKSGEWKWIRHRGKVVETNSNGCAARVAGTGTDITEKFQYMEQLRHANTHDQLTGLYNRSFFDAEIERMKLSRKYPVSIVIADVDGLKITNDSLGHEAGDKLIQQAAKILRESFRCEDVVARIGGDEFAVILPTAEEHVAIEAIKRVVAFIGEINRTDRDHYFSISLGSSTASNADQLGEAQRLADSRMYYYKQRNKIFRTT